MNLAYRMNNLVNQRIKDVLKQRIMSEVLKEDYFYLDRQDILETFQELKDEIVNSKEVTK